MLVLVLLSINPSTSFQLGLSGILAFWYVLLSTVLRESECDMMRYFTMNQRPECEKYALRVEILLYHLFDRVNNWFILCYIFHCSGCTRMNTICNVGSFSSCFDQVRQFSYVKVCSLGSARVAIDYQCM